MMAADYLIMSKSSFSLVPGMLNHKATVLTHPYSPLPRFPHFVAVSKDIANAAEQERESMENELKGAAVKQFAECQGWQPRTTARRKTN